MKRFIILSFIAAVNCFALGIHIWRTGEACPFVCREANGEWYETELPTFGYSNVLWMSEKQKEYRRQAKHSLPLLPGVKS